MTGDQLTLDALADQEAEHRRQMANKERRHAEEKQHLRDQLHEALRERDEARAAFAKLRDNVRNSCDKECYGCGAWYVAEDAKP